MRTKSSLSTDGDYKYQTTVGNTGFVMRILYPADGYMRGCYTFSEVQGCIKYSNQHVLFVNVPR